MPDPLQRVAGSGKGGSGATSPNATSLRTPEPSTDRQMRHHAKVDVADCTKLPDNAAECNANETYFCDDQKLWVGATSR
jgi:hypothetical protein